MELIDEESLQPFKSLMDEYDQSFYTRNIDKFRSLHVSDNGVVFFDNYANCDSNTYLVKKNLTPLWAIRKVAADHLSLLRRCRK